MVEIGGDRLFGQQYNPAVFVLPAIVVLAMFGEELTVNFKCCFLVILMMIYNIKILNINVKYY